MASPTSRRRAKPLKRSGPSPVNFAATLFTVGIVGVGFLAIPTLTGSAAYALAETLEWDEGLVQAASATRAISTASSSCRPWWESPSTFRHVSPVSALFLTAIINGLLAPFLLVAIVIAASDHTLMEGQPSSLLSRVVVSVTAGLMFAAAIGMFVF